ncbi:MAG: hypothetical protein QOA14_09745 [Nitrososphaeraceae archaeon]|nr:hypothetical protein [Nitrososphaeraceae archaeon]MDW3679834.1 hypothetical protein [Nitrososphaeraceae archaeon]
MSTDCACTSNKVVRDIEFDIQKENMSAINVHDIGTTFLQKRMDLMQHSKS